MTERWQATDTNNINYDREHYEDIVKKLVKNNDRLRLKTITKVMTDCLPKTMRE